MSYLKSCSQSPESQQCMDYHLNYIWAFASSKPHFSGRITWSSYTLADIDIVLLLSLLCILQAKRVLLFDDNRESLVILKDGKMI